MWWPEVLRRAWAASGDSGSRLPLPAPPPSPPHARAPAEAPPGSMHAFTQPSWGADAGQRVPGGTALAAAAEEGVLLDSCGDRECVRCRGEYNMHAALRRHLLDGVRGGHAHGHTPLASVLQAVEV